jgi:WD40 repeat protein
MIISRKYEVLDQLGQGGMGIVYRVRHVTLDTIFALKVLPHDFLANPDMVARFYREARVVARLSHPNIVRVSDIDHDEELNFHYFVMEYIQGQTFAAYLRERGALPIQEVLSIARQVANALAYAHGYSPPVIHRDIKPANIMIEDRTGRVVVMDFGIAKELDNTEVTKTGTVIGTLKYCSPEQMRHEPLDGAADLYSLGMVMYEAYAGRQFFAGLDEASVIGKVLYDPQENEPVFSRPAPPAFVSLVTKAIAKSKTQRYQNVAEFLRDLDACGGGADATERIVLPSPATNASVADKTRDEVKELEEQIRKLEEERQKRLVTSAQAQAREARERAAQAGAGRWALALFQDGLSAEELGHERFREQQYPQAQEAYEDAARLFSQAYEEASAAALLHKVEQARQELSTIKSEAERYGARERARTFYGRGLALQARADELWEHHTLQEAEQCYAEARSIFADARDLAYRETLREEAAAAAREMRLAREVAVQEGAREFAAESFGVAEHNEQQAEAALQKEEFFQARELYAAARQQYLSARQHAHTEQQRQYAPAAARMRSRMDAARAVVEGQSSQKQFAEAFTYAQHLTAQGEEQEQQGEYGAAAGTYEQASQVYERIQQDLEQARRRLREQVEEVRVQALAAKETAQQEGAQEWASTLFAEALEHERQAEAAAQRDEFPRARESYLAATRKFAFAEQRAREVRQGQAEHREQALSADVLVPVAVESETARETPERSFAHSAARSPRTSHARLLAVGIGAIVAVGGFYFFASKRSSVPNPPVAISSVVPREPEVPPRAAEPGVSPQVQEEPPVPTPVAPPLEVKSTETTVPEPQQEKLTNLIRITCYTDSPTAEMQLPASSAVRAFFDEREVSLSSERSVHVDLQDVASGESRHVLKLVEEKSERFQEIPVIVHYYPRWEVRQFTEGRDEAYAVAFSPDGHSIVSSSRDKVLKLWDVETGQKLRTFFGHTDWVTSVAFSPDGQTILSGSDDKTLRLWEAATGKRIRVLNGHGDFVNSVAFSPDGKTAVSGSKDGSLKLWNVATGQEVKSLSGHTGWVLAVAFSPDGKSVLSGSDDKTLKLWDVKTGQVVRSFVGHRDAVFSVTFSPRGNLVLSGSHDKTVRLWDVQTGQTLRTFTGHEDWVNGVAFSPDAQLIVSGGKDKTVRLWDVATGRVVRTFLGHESTVAGVAFSPDGKMIVSGSRDKTLRLWWAVPEAQQLEVENVAAAAPSDPS